jgi:hypothetical protein
MLARLPYDDMDWHVDLRATNGDFTARQDFYLNPQTLAEFAVGLGSFPKALGDEVRFEIGAPTGNWVCHVLMRAYLYDAAGHSALEFVINNRGAPPVRRQSSFHIVCEAAAINRLGAELQSWLTKTTTPFIWEVRPP